MDEFLEMYSMKNASPESTFLIISISIYIALHRFFTFLQLNTTNSTLDTYQQHISDLMLKPDLNKSWAKTVNIGTELRSISHPTMAAVPSMVLHMTVLSHC